ncbi:MAG: LytTR family transcriptional regulator DNA-binding domain-containing protein [Tenuifilaceae bacterium]|nr:LytTR family transcriptional regulator DNA-binding domain-containing protein [Tenuifilaceae bacterium]
MLNLRLAALEEQLKASPHIIRVHRSYVVNAVHVKVFTSYNVVVGDKTIPIGRNYREKVCIILAK